MAVFFPVVIRRSDGKIQVKLKNGAFEPNEPTPSQLDSRPNGQHVCDFYRECSEGDAKEVDWRRKLAGMLMRELSPAEPKDTNFILATLPEGYRLYEHVKYGVDPNSREQKQVKNHAAGGNERQDAYLYGHPQGRKKRFRSPAEFFPHLLWLAKDETGNSDNCSCKLCCPEEIRQAKEEAVAPVKQETVATKPTASQPAPAAQSRGSVPSQTRTPAPVQPSPLPRFRSAEQKQDSSSQRPLYRPGEIVWFFKGAAWGLGVIAKRDTSRQAYIVQPMSHPFKSPPQTTLAPRDIRPWLAWSPPPLTCQALNPSAQNGQRAFTYDMVDWNAVCSGSMGPCDAEVDGSILAAKAVENSLTPFQPLPGGSPAEQHYNGIFLGAEKIWVGDAVRTRNTYPEILVLHDIVEHSNKADSSRPRILFVGDVYTWRCVQMETNYVPSDGMTLPARVREDLNFRNSVLASAKDPQKRLSFFWKPDRKSAHLTISDVRGRWYASSELLPILSPEKYEQNKAAGMDVGDVGMIMNGQGDCNKSTVAGPQQGRSVPATLKTSSREEAFGRAVPSAATGFRISKGLDEQAGSPATAGATDHQRPPSAGHQPQPQRHTQPVQAPQQQQGQFPRPGQPGQQFLPQQQQHQFGQGGYGQQAGQQDSDFDRMMTYDGGGSMDFEFH